jgi:hypothetical protein
MSYLQSLEEDRRAWLLRLLDRSGGHANEGVLLTSLHAAGHRRVTRELVRADLHWLNDRGLVNLEWLDETVLVARLTRRGGDVAEGYTAVEGVRKPDPFED